MARYLIKRLLLAVFTLFVILLVSYVLLRLAPGDPTRSSMFGSDAAGSALDASKGALVRNNSMREKLHLDRPVLVGFGCWLADVVLRGDFGTSAAVDPGRPVTDLILARLPVTVSLNFWAVVVTYLCAIPLGVYAAVHADGWFDRGSAFILFLLYSLPVMWVGLLLQSTLAEGGTWPVFSLKGVTGAVALSAGDSALLHAADLLPRLRRICGVVALRPRQHAGSDSLRLHPDRAGQGGSGIGDHLETRLSQRSDHADHPFRRTASIAGRGKRPGRVHLQYSGDGIALAAGVVEPGLSAADGALRLCRNVDAGRHSDFGSALPRGRSPDQTHLSPGRFSSEVFSDICSEKSASSAAVATGK